jgi:hypothetical protein
MARTHLALTLAALPFLFAAAPAPAPTACPNTIPHEPVVLFDVSGSTIGGPIDIGLTVYNDGTVRISSTGQFGLPSQARTAFVGQAAAIQLLLDLSNLGAGQLCDRYEDVPDLPVSTLTVFRNGTDPRNHTYSWVTGDGEYGPIANRLQDFIHTTFPGF